MAKKLVRLTESDLHRIVKESVKRVLNEGLTPVFKAIAKRHGGVKSVDKKYQFDKLDFRKSGGWDTFFESNGSSIPYNLIRFIERVMTFKDGISLFAIRPEYTGNEEVERMLASSNELKAVRSSGYEPGEEWHDIEVDYGAGPTTTYHKSILSPDDMRQRAHMRSRGKGKPSPMGGGDNDYDTYVKNYLIDAFNGYDMGSYIAVPVEDKWDEKADKIRETFMRYGYGEDESAPHKYDFERYGVPDEWPRVQYLAFTKGRQSAYMEYDDPGFNGYGPTNPYGSYIGSKLPPRPKIGRTGF